MSDRSESLEWRFPYSQGYGGGSGDGGDGGEGVEDTDLKVSIPNSAEALSPGPSDTTEPHDDSKHRHNFPQPRSWMRFLQKTRALHRMETGEETYPKWQPGKSERTLRLQRAWVVHSAWASMENVCKISSSVLVNKLQCEHIANHFKVTAQVLTKLGLEKDFVSGQALEGGTGIQTNLTFDEMRFSHIAKTFKKHHVWRGKDLIDRYFMKDFFLETRIQDVSRMFEDYVRELDALDGSTEESVSKQSMTNEGFWRCNLWGMSTKENFEARYLDRYQGGLDEFLCLLLGVLKQGEDLVLFHSGLEGANNGVVERTGLCGEKFVQIHKLLYKLLDIYACLEHCEGTEFAEGYLPERDSCRSQSLLYYLNSNCLGENISLSIDDDFLNIERATTISELLERPNCALKKLCIESSSGVKVDQEEIRKCRLMVIAALSKYVSIRSVIVHGLNEEEVHELYKILSTNKALTHFSFDSRDSNPNVTIEILDSLKKNKTLQVLVLEQSTELDDARVKIAFMDLLVNYNFSLRTIRMCGRDWDIETFIKWKLERHMSMGDLWSIVDGTSESPIVHSARDLKQAVGTLQLEKGEGSTKEVFGSSLRIVDKHKSKVELEDERPRLFLSYSDEMRDFAMQLCMELKSSNYNVVDQDSINFVEAVDQCQLAIVVLSNKYVSFEPSMSKLHTIVKSKRTNNPTLKVYPLFYKLTLKDLQKAYYNASTFGGEGSSLDSASRKEALKFLLEGKNEVSKKAGDLVHILRQGRVDVGKFCKQFNEVLRSSWPCTGLEFEKNAIFEEGYLLAILEEIFHYMPTIKECNGDQILGHRGKLEMESKLSVRHMKPLLESILISDFFLRRKLNMAQYLQDKYIQYSSFEKMCPLNMSRNLKHEYSKGRIAAALFPQTFLYHFAAHMFRGPHDGNFLPILKAGADLVAQKMQQECNENGVQTLTFFDFVDSGAPLDPRRTIAMCQNFSSKTSDGSKQLVIVQDDLTGAYYYQCDEALDLANLAIDEPIGVIGVQVTSTEIHVDNIHEDGSYYSGVLGDFSYKLDSDENKQCVGKVFGDLEGARFLSKHSGIKCSPLLVIALASAIQKKGLTLTWSNGKGHMEFYPNLLQELELEACACQIQYTSNINQLGVEIEWRTGTNNCALHNQTVQRCLDEIANKVQKMGSDVDVNVSTSSSKDGTASVDCMSNMQNQIAIYNAAIQNKSKHSVGIKGVGSGVDVGYEKHGSKAEQIMKIVAKNILKRHYESEGGFDRIPNLDVEHLDLENQLRRCQLHEVHDRNYLVVYNQNLASHVSIYRAIEQNEVEPKFELTWITDILIEGGEDEIKHIFETGLKGRELIVKRDGSNFIQLGSPSKPLASIVLGYQESLLKFKSRFPSNAIISSMVQISEPNLIGRLKSKNEWMHIIGPQQKYGVSQKYWWNATFMQAIVYSRTMYTSGKLLTTRTELPFDVIGHIGYCSIEKDPKKKFEHLCASMVSRGKFSRPLGSLLGNKVLWGGLEILPEELVRRSRLVGMLSGRDKNLEGSTAYSSEALGLSPSDITKPHDDSKHRDNLPQTPFVDLSIESSAKTQALDRIETGEEKYPKWQPGDSERTLRLQRAWVVHSAWASIENVCKLSSSVLVNKLQCEHIADHFKVTADVLTKLGLEKDFVSGQALEGGTGIQTNLTFDEMQFSRMAKTFEKHFFSMKKSDHGVDDMVGSSLLGTQIQDVSSMFENYVRELDALAGSSEESLSKQSKINEGFPDYSLRGMSTKEDVEARSRDCKQRGLDEFLCLLLGVLKQGEDLVLFQSGLEGANNEVVGRTGPYGEKFVQIHKLLYELLEFYACLEHCEGTEFAKGYLPERDSCRSQSLLYYLNSTGLGEYASLSIDDDFLNIELATTLSELLERRNCVLKTLFIEASSRVKINQEELRKCRLMVIAALSKCVSITSLTVRGSNGEEVLELCMSLSVNKVLKNLVISTDGPLNDDHTIILSAMLKKNRSLKSFALESGQTSPKGAAYFGAMLAENSSLEELNLQCWNWDEIGMKHLMRPLMANNGEPQVNLSLKHLHIDIDIDIKGCLSGVAEIIAQLLRINKTLTHFSMKFKDLDPDAACEILDSLKKNKTLQVLDLQGCSSFGNNSEVAACLEAMLVENSTLEELKVDMCMWDEFCLKHLLRPLMANKDGEPHVNISLRRFHILNYNCNRGWEVVKSIAQMLRTNRMLSHFSMINASLDTSDVCEILDSLKINKVLQVLNLDECKGLDDAWVKVAFMDLLVNYNFSLSTIRMHGRDWNIKAFMKSELELDTMMAQGGLWSLVGGISKSPIVRSAYDLNQALEDFQLEKGEGSAVEVHGSSVKTFEEYQEEWVVERPCKLEAISGLRSKLEMESEQSLQELKPFLESVMKSTNFFLRRNLNMAQLLQERYTQWDSFAAMYPSTLTDEEKDEFSKGCITAALFPTTFLYRLKAHLLQGPNSGRILHTLKEVADLVVQRMKILQDSGSQTFQFIDYVDFRAPLDIQHIYSPRETIAICQTFSTRTGIGEELQAENSIQYGIVQDHLTGAYYFDCDKASDLDEPNIDKSAGVIGVKVTSSEIHIEIMWEDGSYYSGALEEFSYDLELDDNKQCALEAFGDLKGAHFLGTRGLKCSPLLVIALATAIRKKGLALTWSNGKGHIQSNSILPSLQPVQLEVWECQILYGDMNQLGEAVEWGMNQFDRNCASSSRDKQCRVVSEQDPDQNIHTSNVSNDTSMGTWISDKPNDTSNHTPNNVDWAGQFNAGAQDKQKWTFGGRFLGSGVDIGFEKQNSKGKTVEGQSYNNMQELHWKKEGGYVIGKLSERHKLLEENLCQHSLHADPVLNYLVVYDGLKASHVSIYWVKETIGERRLELEWITDIFIKQGPKRIKKIFEGLKGETLEVTRTGTQFLENPLQQQSKGLMKWFKKNRLSNEGISLQMVPLFEDQSNQIVSNDEWRHIVGPQPGICRGKFWWKASYMQAITYSRTKYSSGHLLSTHTMEVGLKWGRCTRESRPDELDYVHLFDDVKSCGKFSKAPQSLSTKWHEMIYWGGCKQERCPKCNRTEQCECGCR